MNKILYIIGFNFYFLYLKISLGDCVALSDFNIWLEDFKKEAINKGISKKTVDETMKDAKFLA